MYLLLVIYAFLLLVQLVLGIFAYRIKKSLKRKYSYYLGEQIEFNNILEEYQKHNPNLQIIATDEINDVCIAEEDVLIINKKSIYAKDLYSNLYLLFQLKLTSSEFKDIRRIYIYQSITFVSQIVFLILFFVLPEIATIVLLLGFVSLFLNLFLIYYGISVYNQILRIVLKEARKILSLDKVEMARAETLVSELKYEVLTYALEIPWRLSEFWRI
ncbi:hypothetical protein BROC_02145 [Candidatus Brocadiaceae bacterium]|nr:hypothetical protein [Candidatus Dojkabacteria bacterium]CAG0943136.1 hypothetical protein BROC_02145 [Candidatus Brocadiaceae bacterium]